MRLERVKNAKRNIISGFFNKLIILFFPFIIRSIIIRKLGSEYLGLNNLFSSILQVLNLSELGFSNAIVYIMYKPIAENNTEHICAILKFYRNVYRIIGTIVLVIGLIPLPVLDRFISGSVPPGINIYILYVLYLLNTVLSYFLFAYKSSVLVAYQRNDIVTNSLTVTQSLMYIFQIITLVITTNYYLYLWWMPFFTIINNIINAVKANRCFPEIKCKGKISKSDVNRIKKQVPGLMINKLCIVSRNSFDNIFISTFLGLRISAIYGNYYYIMNAVVGLLTIFSNSILAGVGNSLVMESPNENYQTMRKINFIYMWIAGWCTSLLLCLYQPFMEVWVGKDLLFPISVVILFCIYFYVMEIGVIRSVYSDAAGLWWQNRYRAILETVINVILNYILVKIIGIYGVIIATIISIVGVNFLWGSQIVFDYYFKNNKCGEYYFDQIKFFFVTALGCLCSFFICSKIQFNPIITMIINIFISSLIMNIIYCLIYYKTKLFNASFGWIKQKVYKH